MITRDISTRSVSSLLGAFVAVTLAWLLWGCFTPGDYFANGSNFGMPSLIVAAIFGFIVGFRARQWWIIFVFVIAIASLCFWIFVPDGWWAHEPPFSGREIQSKSERSTAAVSSEKQ